MVMYALPHFAQFYAEVCNLLLESHVASASASASATASAAAAKDGDGGSGQSPSTSSATPGSISVLYSAADALELRAVLGEARAEELVREARARSKGQLSTQPSTHTFSVK